MITRLWAERAGRTRWIGPGRAVWELLHAHPEIDYVRTEVYLDRSKSTDPDVLATDVAGGVLWIDQDGDNNRQIIQPDGSLARNAAWLAERRQEGRAPD